MLSLQQSQYLSLPEEPGVYLFLNRRSKIIYVGKAKNLKNRVYSYFAAQSGLGYRTKLLIEEINKIKFIVVTSEVEALLLEASLIKKYQPYYNVKMTDGKSFPFIRITIKDKLPKILIERNDNDKNSVYFGPYPEVVLMKEVLRIIRKIFPYQSVNNHPKSKCLYNHLGLCPCPPTFKTQEEVKEYKSSIRKIIQFLEGKVSKVNFELEKERDKFSLEENYEKAKEIQTKIDAIQRITTYRINPLFYEENPNLREDLKQQEIDSLLKKLKENKVEVQKLERIECYDISNTSGLQATGSMVVFKEGEKSSSEYRRFKIKGNYKKPDDYAMIGEVIKRRFSRTDWTMPDLVIIDGGKGQISSVVNVLKQMKIYLPVLGLAKREERIITESGKNLVFPRNSMELKLIMRIRDEAHRFALLYHKKLRSKAIFE